MKKTIAIFRTHEINEAIISEFAKMQNCGVDTLLLINNSFAKLPNYKNGKEIEEREFFGLRVKCLLLQQEDYVNLGFYNFEDIGYNFWFNVTYGLFIVANNFYKDYDFYWCFDWDVFLNAKDYKDFFEHYDKDESDFIISHFRKEDYDTTAWHILYDTQWAYDTKEFFHGCLCSIERYSLRFIKHLFIKYKEMTERFLNFNGQKQWIHPEVICATEAVKAGFKIKNFTEDGHVVHVPPHYTDLNNKIFLKPDGKMYHPVKPNIVKKLLDDLHNQHMQINALLEQESNLNNFSEQVLHVKQQLSSFTEQKIQNKNEVITIKDQSYKKHLSYQLGQALIKAHKSWYKGGYIKFIFEAIKIGKEFKRAKQ
ncbi:hypothetical protein [Campylobacter avium]|uniref:hypothetical protein n=1 Tax=Campylobacter avium TaxID=522485 RepID=UPI00248CC97F|nr:hypothetical protein [Campylobacter avium]